MAAAETHEVYVRLYSVLPSFFFFFFVSATFETQRGTYSSILFFSHLTCTLQRHKLVTAKMFSMFSVGGAYMNINEFPGHVRGTENFSSRSLCLSRFNGIF